MPYVVIKRSTNPKKKLMAVFTRHDGSKKTTHFGQADAPDYTITKDKAQRKRYLDRHRKNERWDKPETAGSLSRYILWGSTTSRRENIKLFKKRFGYKN